MKKGNTLKLISAEGFEFVIDKEAAMVSQTIRNMLTSPGNFVKTLSGEVTFTEVEETDFFHIEPEVTLELMMAANYLHT